jgi:ABC-type phosphate transport system substrate-binding protein
MTLLRLTRRSAWLLGMGLVLGVVPAVGGEPPAPEFKVIVHPERPAQLTRAFLADAFLKRATRWADDEALRPVDQRSDSAVRRRFSDQILRRSVEAVKTYWQQRIFSGRGVPPPELDSDEAVVRYVESHAGAVGYISGSAPSGKTRVIAITP